MANNQHLFVFSNPKAGMDGIDRAAVNQTIYDLSKDSAFFKNTIEKDAQVDKKIQGMRLQLQQKRRHDLVSDVDARVLSFEESRDLSRVYLVIDMDMFFAAVEMRDDPSLEHVPMAVGGMGMLSTANYTARKFGVRAAMPGFIAKKLCPALVLVKPNYDKYKIAADQTREIFREYDPNFISGSLDEAYLDITPICHERITASNKTLTMEDSAAAITAEIRQRITERTRLTASAGIAATPRLAKICSDINKPNGQYLLPFNRDAILKFVHHLPVRKFGGVGKVREKMLSALNITNGLQLFESRYDLFHVFSETTAQWLLSLSLGVCESRHVDEQTHQKSVRETTFGSTGSLQELLERCQELAKRVDQDLLELQLRGRCLTLKLKSTSFAVKTRAWTCKNAMSLAEMLDTACRLVVKEFNAGLKAKETYRLIGIRMSMLEPRQKQPIESNRQKQKTLEETKLVLVSSVPSPLQSTSGITTDSVSHEFDTTNDTSSQEQREPCPICGHRFEVYSAFLVNEHVDQCLKKSKPKSFRSFFQTTQ